jgi:hypothetical protein
MLDNAVRICASRWRSLTAHGYEWLALFITLTEIVSNLETLDACMLFIAQEISVPISRGSPSVSSV